jgi:hypothetical protein
MGQINSARARVPEIEKPVFVRANRVNFLDNVRLREDEQIIVTLEIVRVVDKALACPISTRMANVM